MPDVAFEPTAADLRRANTFTRNPAGENSRRFAEFYKNPLNNEDYIHIILPGDKTTDIRRPVKHRDTLEFPQEWQAFKAGADQFAGQIKLEEVVWVNVAMRRHLAALQVFTVEQLAQVPDNSLHNFPHGAFQMRNRAREEIAKKEGEQVAAKTEAVDKRLEALEEQNRLLREQLEKSAAADKPKRRGRPRKDAKATETPTGDVSFTE